MSGEAEGDATQSPVPKLRFPEFRDAGAWTRRNLGPYLREHTGRVAATTKIPVYSSSRSGLTPQDEYFDGSNLQNSGQYSVVPEDHITYRHMSDDGVFKFNVNRTGQRIAVSKEYPVFETIGLSSDFLLNILNDSQDFRHFALSQKKGGTRTRLYLNVLKTWEPLLPPNEAEQQKIAECLSSLDAVIASEGERLAALKEYKKGLMQALFPALGGTTPRLRFPKFEGKGEWNEKALSDLTPFVTSGSRGWATFYADEGDLFVRMTNLWRDSIYLDLTDLKFVKLPSSANEGIRTQLKNDDVLISITADIGIIGYVDEGVPKPAYVNQHIALVRFDQSKVCAKYVAYYLSSARGQQTFAKMTDNGTKAGISLISIQKIAIMLPTQGEQEEIANHLTSLDSIITAQRDKLETLKNHKKALMQQLFPATTGARA